MSFAEGLDPNSVMSGANYLTRPAHEYVNDQSVEAMWVMQAVDFSEVHYNLISSVDPKLLRLTKDDERVYRAFIKEFPQFNVQVVTEESLKSSWAKEKWRKFCEEFKDVEDYSYGTLLRLNSNTEYSEENTILVTRIQFLAIEIARNRMGFNDNVYYSKTRVPDVDKLKIT